MVCMPSLPGWRPKPQYIATPKSARWREAVALRRLRPGIHRRCLTGQPRETHAPGPAQIIPFGHHPVRQAWLTARGCLRYTVSVITVDRCLPCRPPVQELRAVATAKDQTKSLRP